MNAIIGIGKTRTSIIRYAASMMKNPIEEVTGEEVLLISKEIGSDEFEGAIYEDDEDALFAIDDLVYEGTPHRHYEWKDGEWEQAFDYLAV